MTGGHPPQLTSDDLISREIEIVTAWRNRMQDLSVHLEDAQYDDESGAPTNRPAEVRSALLISIEEDIDPVLRRLQALRT